MRRPKGSSDHRRELENEARRRPRRVPRLDLSLVEPLLWQQTEEAFIERDVVGLLASMSSEVCLRFVFDNLALLREAGLYEHGLAHAYSATRTNNRDIPLGLLYGMLDLCDPDKLRAAGAPLPGPGPLTIYRGVAGKRQRRVLGPSYTGDLDTACWFATRYELPQPAIYSRIVQPDQVYLCIGGRDEREIVCRSGRPVRCEITEYAIHERADAHAAMRKAKVAAGGSSGAGART